MHGVHRYTKGGIPQSDLWRVSVALIPGVRSWEEMEKLIPSIPEIHPKLYVTPDQNGQGLFYATFRSDGVGFEEACQLASLAREWRKNRANLTMLEVAQSVPETRVIAGQSPEELTREIIGKNERRTTTTLSRSSEFRERVLPAWNFTCPVTGNSTLRTLQVAHIHVVEPRNDSTFNGVPLRADIHLLFDAKSKDAFFRVLDDGSVVFCLREQLSDYREFDGKEIAIPSDLRPKIVEMIAKRNA